MLILLWALSFFKVVGIVKVNQRAPWETLALYLFSQHSLFHCNIKNSTEELKTRLEVSDFYLCCFSV